MASMPAAAGEESSRLGHSRTSRYPDRVGPWPVKRSNTAPDGRTDLFGAIDENRPPLKDFLVKLDAQCKLIDTIVDRDLTKAFEACGTTSSIESAPLCSMTGPGPLHYHDEEKGAKVKAYKSHSACFVIIAAVINIACYVELFMMHKGAWSELANARTRAARISTLLSSYLYFVLVMSTVVVITITWISVRVISGNHRIKDMWFPVSLLGVLYLWSLAAVYVTSASLKDSMMK